MLGQPRSNILCFLTGTLTLGMLGSTFLTSASMFFIGFLSLADFQNNRLQFNKDFFPLLKRFWGNYAFSAFTLCILLVFITWGYSANKSYLLERARIKLPFFGTFLAFFILPKVGNLTLKYILFIFITIIAVSELVVLTNYFFDFKNINIEIGQGGYMPTPSNHIRYSILVAFSLLFAIELWINAIKFDIKKEVLVLKLSIALGLVAIHVITVRSGLFIFYVVALIRIIAYIWSQKKWIYFLYFICLGSVFLFLSYRYIPSLKEKVSYTLWDMEMYQKGTILKYSDGERFTSIEAGLEVGKINKTLGVGYGDMYDEIKYYYYSHHPELSVIIPHNQFVTTFAGAGFVGLVLLLIGLFVPLYLQIKNSNWFFIMVILSMILSFIFESTIENTLGVTIMAYWAALFLNFGKNESE
jgi:O-antigen ligase